MLIEVSVLVLGSAFFILGGNYWLLKHTAMAVVCFAAGVGVLWVYALMVQR